MKFRKFTPEEFERHSLVFFKMFKQPKEPMKLYCENCGESPEYMEGGQLLCLEGKLVLLCSPVCVDLNLAEQCASTPE